MSGMIDCLCKYGRINEYKKLFLKAWDVPEWEIFEPMESDCDIMDAYVTWQEPSWEKTLAVLKQRLIIMSPKTEFILEEGLTLLQMLFSSVSYEERDEIQKKRRRNHT